MKYGYLAYTEIIVGAEQPDGSVEVFMPLDGFQGRSAYTSFLVPADKIKKNLLKITLVEINENSVDVLLPDSETVLTIDKKWFKKRRLASLFNRIRGKSIKKSEFGD